MAESEKARMVVQGAWISQDERAVLEQEVKDKKLRSTTALASKIIRDWVNRKRAKQGK